MSKEKKNKVVPKLRFPEFKDDGYRKTTLGEIAGLIEERAGTKEYTTMSVTSGIGLISQKEKFGREIAGNQYKNYYVIRKWDFAYNKSATKLYPEGYISMLKSLDAAAVPNSIFTCFRITDKEVIPPFLDHLFHDNLHGKWLRKFIEVGARAHGSLSVDTDALFSLPLRLPSSKEQQKITDCLSSLDELIAAESEKLEALQDHKKGLMQALFPAEGERVPKLRFPEFDGDWSEKRLGEIATFLKGKGISKSDIVEDGKQECIRYGELYTHYHETIDVVKSCTNIPRVDLVLSQANDVIIPSSGETKEDIATASCVLRSNIALGGDLNIIRSRINGVFLSYFLNNSKRQEISQLAQGYSVVHLYPEQLKKLIIKIPELDEQKEIADCLASIDDLITARKEKVEVLKVHKKGLMQQLFPAANEE